MYQNVKDMCIYVHTIHNAEFNCLNEIFHSINFSEYVLTPGSEGGASGSGVTGSERRGSQQSQETGSDNQPNMKRMEVYTFT